jgi:hypothetical protein
MTHQVNTQHRGRVLLIVAAAVLALVAVVLAVRAPHAVPLPHQVPLPDIGDRERAAVEDDDLSATARLRDSPALREVDRRFGDWNEAESADFGVERTLGLFRTAFLRLGRSEQVGFLAARAIRFLVAIDKVRGAVREGHEDHVALGQMRALVGRHFEDRAMHSGLIHADDLVLRAAFKLRILLAVDPGAVDLVSRAERIAFHGFLAAEARGQDLSNRLRSVEQLGKLDRSYPVDLAAAILLHTAGDDAAASDRLLHARRPSTETRNHLLWLAARRAAH